MAIVIPVLDDWDSLGVLTSRISEVFAGTDILLDIVVVDDGSLLPSDAYLSGLPQGGPIASVEILRLTVNLGHQRAIAVGLLELAARSEHDEVIVMDSDGEDRPEDLLTLLSTADKRPSQIIVAQRGTRSEGLSFRAAYGAYKVLFRTLTGLRIDFGNFCLLPKSALKRITQVPEIWNHFAATIARSRIPFTKVLTDRGVRYAGTSRMRLLSLVVHGLSAISVYSEVFLARMLIACMGMLGILTTGIIAVLGIKFFTTLAIPGWATTAIGILTVLFMQTALLMGVIILVVLSGRSWSRPVSRVDHQHLIAERIVHRVSPALRLVGQ